MSINREMDKQIVVYPYKGILLGNRKYQNTDARNNMDESQEPYVNQRNQTQKITYNKIPQF